MRCKTTQKGLDRLGKMYNILSNIDFQVPSKSNTPSCPPRRYITFYLVCFKLDVRLLLQPYFARILS